MRLDRRQFVLLGGALAVEWAAGCSTGGNSTKTPPVSTTAPVSTSSSADAASMGAGVAQALRSNTVRGASGSPAEAGAALDDLGASLLGLMPADSNVVLSPYSIYAVLAMARAGAKGATAAQLDHVLGSASVQAGSMTAIDAAIAAAVRTGAASPPDVDPATPDTRPVTVDVANSVWLAPRFQVRQAYLDTLAAGFGVGVYQVDYAASPEAATKTINAWVSQHTARLIPALLDPGVITPVTVLTLVNAVHLSAPWADPLDAGGAPLPFTTAAGHQVQAPGMSYLGALATATGKGWVSVTIPYKGAGMAMTVVMPDRKSFATVRSDLAEVLRAATKAIPVDRLQFQMPKFGAQTHLSLEQALQALRVTDLFDAGADLSGIAGRPGDYMAGDLIHQAVISVDEKGTEAAAATAMPMMPASSEAAPQTNVIIDRPFFYSVHDTVTGAPLFLGQVTDPTE